MLEPISRRSLSDAVFAQLRDQIVGGEMPPGAPLPAERALCEALGVNRGAVREALRRLEQARLVSVRHGGTSRVLDYRESAGMDLLAELILDARGHVDSGVVRSILEMRSAIAPDIARLAADRADAALAERLAAIVASMGAAAGDLAELQKLAHAFWSELVRGCDNVAYRLAFNDLDETYARSWDLLRELLADEFGATPRFAALADAVARRDPAEAQAQAREIVRVGETLIVEALARMDRLSASSGSGEGS